MLLIFLLLVRRLWGGEKGIFFSGSGFLGLEILIVWEVSALGNGCLSIGESCFTFLGAGSKLSMWVLCDVTQKAQGGERNVIRREEFQMP